MNTFWRFTLLALALVGLFLILAGGNAVPGIIGNVGNQTTMLIRQLQGRKATG